MSIPATLGRAHAQYWQANGTFPLCPFDENTAEYRAYQDARTAEIERLTPAGERPFGAVAFDPQRRADDVDPDSGYTNGQRANIGMGVVAAYCFLADKPEAKAILINDIDLTEAPDEAVTDLLANLMHYCHREGIEFYGEDGVLPAAQRHFGAESGGAAL